MQTSEASDEGAITRVAAAASKKARDGAGMLPAADIADSGIAADRLRSFIERIERLEEEKVAIASDIKDVYAELKGEGFDTKAVRQIVRLRKLDHAERQEQEAVLELYLQALGVS